MIFNSFQFLWLFPLIFIGYWLLNITVGGGKLGNKVINIALIVVSYGLYMQWKPIYALLLFGVTLITYSSALLIERRKAYGNQKYIIISASILALLPLLIFKYYNFINDSIAGILKIFGIATEMPGLNWAIPIGISFYSFQAIGYLFDVYYQRVKAERNWWDYMLFVSFFPQIMSGPISKAKDLLPQIKAERQFNYTRAVDALKLLLWGMFLKVVMADRLGLYADTVFNNWQYNTGVSCLVASFAYTFQIYGDFAGYSLMAVAVGKLLGFELINNFNRPYLSVSITEFWRRWHISLSTWLKDYVYIPLGGSRCSKTRNYFNIFITFLVSGIWHGANWTFVLWGILHGLFQILEKALGLQKCESKNTVIRIARILTTFLIVNFLWTVFRMPTFTDATGVIAKMFTWEGAMMPMSQSVFVYMSLAMLILSELNEEYFDGKYSLLNNKHLIIRWIVYLVLIGLILIGGVLDNSQFIYVSF